MAEGNRWMIIMIVTVIIMMIIVMMMMIIIILRSAPVPVEPWLRGTLRPAGKQTGPVAAAANIQYFGNFFIFERTLHLSNF